MLDLGAHVGDVEVGDRALLCEQRRGGVRVVGVHVNLQRRLVADDEHRVAEALEREYERTLLQAAARDREVRAVPVAARGVLRMGHAGGGVVLERRRLTAPERADDAGEQNRQRVAAGVHHARFAQDRE